MVAADRTATGRAISALRETHLREQLTWVKLHECIRLCPAAPKGCGNFAGRARIAHRQAARLGLGLSQSGNVFRLHDANGSTIEVGQRARAGAPRRWPHHDLDTPTVPVNRSPIGPSSCLAGGPTAVTR
jgi:hypothetical protein